jgi:hypothetical protein
VLKTFEISELLSKHVLNVFKCSIQITADPSDVPQKIQALGCSTASLSPEFKTVRSSVPEKDYAFV